MSPAAFGATVDCPPGAEGTDLPGCSTGDGAIFKGGISCVCGVASPGCPGAPCDGRPGTPDPRGPAGLCAGVVDLASCLVNQYPGGGGDGSLGYRAVAPGKSQYGFYCPATSETSC